MKSSIISSTLRRTVRAALLAAVAGTALVAAPGASAQNVQESRSVINSSAGENSARVEVRNNKYTILLNGKEVKSGTTDEAWTTFDLVNEDGESVGTITRGGDEFSITLDGRADDTHALSGNAFGGNAHLNAPRAERDAQRAARGGLARAYAIAPGNIAVAGAWGGPPRTMLGVTLENPGEALSAQLGIDRENTTVLSSITDGLPASKSGLKLYDVITEVNGEPAAPDTLRRILREKNAGDILALKVISSGSRKDVSVTLESYDASRLSTVSGAWSPGPASGGTFTINADAFDERLQEKSRLLEELGRKLAEKSAAMQNAGTDAKALEALGEQMNKIGEEMNKAGEEMARAGASNWNIFPGSGQNSARTIIGRRSGSGGSMPFVFPVPPPASATPAPPGGTDLTHLHTIEAAALKQRMDQMDERLAKLIELMEIKEKNQGTTTGSGGSGGGSTPKKDN